MVIDHQCVIVLGVVWTKFKNCMKCVIVLNVIVRNNLLLILQFITPKQFQLKGGSIKSKLPKILERDTSWNKFLKPTINATAPFIGMAVSAKTKNPKVGQATTNILKSFSGGKI